MFRKLCVLSVLAVTANCWSLTPEQLTFNDISTIKDQDIAVKRYQELAEQSIARADMLLELAARSTTNRIYILNNQQRYAESSAVAQEAIAQFEQHKNPHIRAVVVSLLLNQSSAMKKLGNTELHLHLLKRVADDYQDDEDTMTQTLVALALLAQVDAYLLAGNRAEAQTTFAIFDKRYMQSRLYRSFELEGVSTLCDTIDPCQPYANGKYWLSPKFFADRAAWYRKQLNIKPSKMMKPNTSSINKVIESRR